MKCLEAQRLIRPFLEKTLTRQQLQEFVAHVDGCPYCRDELEIYLAVYATLEQSGDAVRPVRGSRRRAELDEYNFPKQVEASLREAKAQLRRRRWNRIGHAGISAAFCGGIFLFVLAQRGVWQPNIRLQGPGSSAEVFTDTAYEKIYAVSAGGEPGQQGDTRMALEDAETAGEEAAEGERRPETLPDAVIEKAERLTEVAEERTEGLTEAAEERTEGLTEAAEEGTEELTEAAEEGTEQLTEAGRGKTDSSVRKAEKEVVKPAAEVETETPAEEWEGEAVMIEGEKTESQAELVPEDI